MARVVSSLGVLLVAFVLGVYLHLRPHLTAMGVGATFHSIGNGNCTTVSELQACEKVVLHQATGLVFLACSVPHTRTQWTPALGRLNASGMSGADYVATYDPQTNVVTKLQFVGFSPRGGIAVHGMDVVESTHDPSTLYVYLVNHRRPEGADPNKVGADSVIELFETQLGSSILKHIKTFEDPTVIITPNDVVGSPDGKSFHFTNDHQRKAGFRRLLTVLTQPSDTSIGFCHIDQGCKFAYWGLHASNGIVRGPGPLNDTYYVADFTLGDVTVLEMQSDNTLVFREVIKIGRAADNLSVDANGALWIAVLADALGLFFRQFNDPSALVASAAVRVTANQGPSSFYGEKYNVATVFEDPGEIASGSTSAVYDSQRRRLFMHGIISPHLTICNV